MSALISVGLPVYNAERYLRHAVSSVLSQDFEDFELIISDNASTDATRDICAEYAAADKRVRYFRNASNIGAAPNFNRVFSLAKGQFFKWLSCDDECCPGMLRRCAEVMATAPNSVALVYPQGEVIDENGVPVGPMLEHVGTRRLRPHQRLSWTLFKHNSAIALCGLIRSSDLKRTRLRGSFVMDDCALLAELAMLGEIWEIPDVLLRIRLHPANALASCDGTRSLMTWLDPENKRKVFFLPPRARFALEIFRAVSYLPLLPLDKLLCYAVIVPSYYRRPDNERAVRNLCGRLKRRILQFWGLDPTERARHRQLTRVAANELQGLVLDLSQASFPHGTDPEGKHLEHRLKDPGGKRKRIFFFGHFGSPNFGNEITLQAMLYHVRCALPKAEVACICTGPEALAATQNIETVPISRTFVKPGKLRTRLARLLRRVFIGVPSELCRWLDDFRTLRGADVLIIPGTGLLTDVYGLLGWGPYNLFRWSLIARLRRCRVRFVSVGVGPIYSAMGRYLVRSALSLADFRSYRDNASLEYLKRIGFETNCDRVYPDLVFSLPGAMLPHDGDKSGKRSIVGLGLMWYAGKYSVAQPGDAVYQEYLDNLVVFARWLLAHNYDIRVLIGEVGDRSVSVEFKSLLKAPPGTYDEERVIDEPALSVEQLLPQIAATDIVVATRFHNVLLALLLNKPVISISFHHKCASLMSEMGLAEYCHDINHMNASRLIEQFQNMERNAEKLKPLIRQKVEQSRKALDEQYMLIFNGV
jgi:polysaccharide pyruvyl transferase WcaK-like protein/glycosyltransferase involved in cell wall biosynthesis